MTKEEILLKETSGIFDEYEGGITGIFNAMSEYAKQQAIEYYLYIGDQDIERKKLEADYDDWVKRHNS